jgi:hypothetical protein
MFVREKEEGSGATGTLPEGVGWGMYIEPGEAGGETFLHATLDPLAYMSYVHD